MKSNVLQLTANSLTLFSSTPKETGSDIKIEIRIPKGVTLKGLSHTGTVAKPVKAATDRGDNNVYIVPLQVFANVILDENQKQSGWTGIFRDRCAFSKAASDSGESDRRESPDFKGWIFRGFFETVALKKGGLHPESRDRPETLRKLAGQHRIQVRFAKFSTSGLHFHAL
ncbi:MAG: hypothetical protein GY866_23785 [Proteobacteria bacterium]|nr:hypothetical protein [Pseudomonadota bacterium]